MTPPTLSEIEEAEVYHLATLRVVPNDPYTAAISMALFIMEHRLGHPMFMDSAVAAADPLSSQRDVSRIQRECEDLAIAIAHSEWEPSRGFRHTKEEFIDALNPIIGRRSMGSLR